jgi:hypothetical protein
MLQRLYFYAISDVVFPFSRFLFISLITMAIANPMKATWNTSIANPIELIGAPLPVIGLPGILVIA